MNSHENRERMDKLTETFLYNLGYEHVNNICEELDFATEDVEDVEVPQRLHLWFKDFVQKREIEANKKQRRKKIQQVAKRAAIIILIIFISTTALTLSVEALRIKFFNMIIETREKFSNINFSEDAYINGAQDLPDNWEGYYPTKIPEGYSVTSYIDEGDMKIIIYNSGEEELFFQQGPIDSNYQLDTENTQPSEEAIGDYEGVLVEKEGYSYAVWHNNDKSFYLEGVVDIIVLQEIAESIEKK